MNKEIRWHQRYENLTIAYKQFMEAIDRDAKTIFQRSAYIKKTR
ncbi:hypothetical protein [Fusibacter sp. 3D3]|nr:hypothetical protein [Fusibacter sp. 3D3]